MKTLDELKAACHIEVDDDGREHWIFQGCIKADGIPKVVAPDRRKGGAMTVMNARRFAWQERSGRAMDKGRCASCMCDHPHCVHPNCQQALTKAQIGARRRGKYKGDPRYAAAGRKSREGRRVATPELAARILSSDLSGPKLARELNVKPSVVWDVRSGRNKGVMLQSAGIFAGLVR